MTLQYNGTTSNFHATSQPSVANLIYVLRSYSSRTTFWQFSSHCVVISDRWTFIRFALGLPSNSLRLIMDFRWFIYVILHKTIYFDRGNRTKVSVIKALIITVSLSTVAAAVVAFLQLVGYGHHVSHPLSLVALLSIKTSSVINSFVYGLRSVLKADSH